MGRKNSNQTSLFSNKKKMMKLKYLNLMNKINFSKKDILLNEFQSIGFYMSDHPLNIFKDYFNDLKNKILLKFY